MKQLILAAIIIAAFSYCWKFLTTQKPDWFLESIVKIPLVNSSVFLDFDKQSQWTETTVQESFDHLFFKCADESSNLGDRVCFARISSFNGVPATLIAFFFKNGRYHYLRVSSASENHAALRAGLDKKYSYLGESRSSTQKFGQPLGMWSASTGIISMFVDEPADKSETLVTWVRR